jgi:hypothetical protein
MEADNLACGMHNVILVINILTVQPVDVEEN